VTYLSKIANFYIQQILNVPLGWHSRNFVSQFWNNGATAPWKNFDIFSRFDNIPDRERPTDWQTDG